MVTGRSRRPVLGPGRRCWASCWRRSGRSSAPRCSCSTPAIRCSAGVPAGFAGCARRPGGHGHVPGPPRGGSARAARTWRCSPRPPTRGGAGSARTACCRVAGCGYGVARAGTVQSARSAVGPRRPARPARVAGCAAGDQAAAPGSGLRGSRYCDLWPQAALPFCHGHANTWKANGRPAMPRSSSAAIDEVAVPARADHPARTARPAAATGDPVRAAVAGTTSGPPRPSPRWSCRWCGPWRPAPVTSLLDRTEDEWRRGSAARRRATPTCAPC